MQKPYKLLENVLTEIELKIKEEINVDSLADNFTLSKVHLRRLFQSAFNQPISGYIRSRKLSASMEKLLNTDVNVLDIALEYGFGFEQSYIRAFKNEFGMTPGSFRKNRHEVKIKPPLHIFNADMKHMGTKKFVTNNLILRQFVIDDVAFMYRNWANDKEVTRYLIWDCHSSINESSDILEQWINNYSKNDFYQWAIVLKEINEPIGSISVVDKSDKDKMVHVGYCIGKKWWNKGITTEALNILIKYFFERVGVSRIEATHISENQYSGMVMANCGMQFEGHRKQADKIKGKMCDLMDYGMFSNTYFEKIK